MWNNTNAGFFGENEAPVDSSSTSDSKEKSDEACSLDGILNGKFSECKAKAQQVLLLTYNEVISKLGLGEGIKVLISPALLPFLNSIDLTKEQVPWALIAIASVVVMIFIKLPLGFKIIIAAGMCWASPLWGVALLILTLALGADNVRIEANGGYQADRGISFSDYIFLTLILLVGLGFAGAMAWIPIKWVIIGVIILLIVGFIASIPRVVEKSASTGIVMIGLIIFMVILMAIAVDATSLARFLTMLKNNDWIRFYMIPTEDYDADIKATQTVEFVKMIEEKVIKSGGLYRPRGPPSLTDPASIVDAMYAKMDKMSKEEQDKLKSAPVNLPKAPTDQIATTSYTTVKWFWAPLHNGTKKIFSILEVLSWLFRVFCIAAFFMNLVMTQYIGRQEIMARAEQELIQAKSKLDVTRLANIQDGYGCSAALRLISIPLFLMFLIETGISSVYVHGINAAGPILWLTVGLILCYYTWLALFREAWSSAGLNRQLSNEHIKDGLCTGTNQFAGLGVKTRVSTAFILALMLASRFLHLMVTESIELWTPDGIAEIIFCAATIITMGCVVIGEDGKMVTNPVRDVMSLLFLYQVGAWYSMTLAITSWVCGFSILPELRTLKVLYINDDKEVYQFIT